MAGVQRRALPDRKPSWNLARDIMLFHRSSLGPTSVLVWLLALLCGAPPGAVGYVNSNALVKECTVARLVGGLRLNRILVDEAEVNADNTVVLEKDDYRFNHIRTILKLEEGDSLKLGVTDVGLTDDGCVRNSSKAAVVLFLGAPGTLDTSSAAHAAACCVDLLLAVPRPLRLERLLPIIACMGVGQLVLLGAAKVEKDYFGSHLFRRPDEMRRGFVEGLSQAAVDVRCPTVSVHKRLGDFLSDDLDARFPPEIYKRVIAHPPSAGQPEQRLMSLPADGARQTRVVVAVGPEGGWEDQEVQLFLDRGFEPVSLGGRILRTDMAVPVLLGLAHEWVALRGGQRQV